MGWPMDSQTPKLQVNWNFSTIAELHIVADLIIWESRQWDRSRLNFCFLNICIPSSPTHVTPPLAPSFDGKFSVQAAYHLDQFHRFLSHEVLTKQDWTLLWKLKIHEWLKLLWKLAWDTLSTRSVLKFRIPATEEHYSTCQYPSESTIHLFLKCPILHRCGVWSSSLWSLPLCSNGFPNNGSSDQIHHIFRRKTSSSPENN